MVDDGFPDFPGLFSVGPDLLGCSDVVAIAGFEPAVASLMPVVVVIGSLTDPDFGPADPDFGSADMDFGFCSTVVEGLLLVVVFWYSLPQEVAELKLAEQPIIGSNNSSSSFVWVHLVSISADMVPLLMVPDGSFLVLSDADETVVGIIETVAEATAPTVGVGPVIVVVDNVGGIELVVPVGTIGIEVVPIIPVPIDTILATELDESMEAIATEAAATEDNRDAAECWCLGGSCLLWVVGTLGEKKLLEFTIWKVF